jgi:FkbM family methyltransferase
MHTKALTRHFYSIVPGLASARFALMDLTASWIAKPEYDGVARLKIGNGLIIDVGANRGQSTAIFRKLAPKATIVAFEPEHRSAAQISSRYRDDRSIRVHGCALGARSGEITFYIPTYGRWNCDGMAATDRATATDWLKDPGRMYHFDERKLSIKEHVVQCRTLDSYELSPRLIKLHAQGAELDILKGASETLLRHQPALMCAFPPPTVSSFLTEYGYRSYNFKKSHFISGVAERPITFTWYFTERHMQLLKSN